MTEEVKKHNTIYDDVFRTMVQKMPELLIPVINEVFHTDYTQDCVYEQLRNEHQEVFGKVVSDSIIKIENHIYHIECQSLDDSTMAFRMMEYDFAIALEDALLEAKEQEMCFPDSCVLYLRGKCNNRKKKRNLQIKIRLPGGEELWYKTRMINVQDYSIEEIF